MPPPHSSPVQITARTKAEEDERSSAPVASTSAPSTDPRKMAAAAGDGAIADNKDAIMSQALVETRRILEKRNMEIEVRLAGWLLPTWVERNGVGLWRRWRCRSVQPLPQQTLVYLSHKALCDNSTGDSSQRPNPAYYASRKVPKQG